MFLDRIITITAPASTVVPLPDARACGGAANSRPLNFRGNALAQGVFMIAAIAVAFAAPARAQNGPKTLEECVAMALQSNLRIEAAAEKLTEMDAAIEEAATSQMPKLSAQAAYTRMIPQPSQSVPVAANLGSFLQELQKALGTGDFSQFPPTAAAAPLIYQKFKASGNIYTADLSLSQVIYTGGKITNAKKIAQQSRTMSEWQRKSAVREIRRDVTKAYYSALAANRSIVALDSAISMMEVMIKDLGNAVEVGMRGEHELLQAQVQLLNQRLARQQAATGSQSAHDYLATMIGIPVNTPFSLVEDMEAPESYTVIEPSVLQAKAREASTDLKTLDEQLKIIETSLLITGSSNIPTVAAAASYNGQGMGGFGKDFDWTNGGRLSLVAMWDIYDGNSVSYKKRQTLSQKRQLELNMENLRINLDMMVKNHCASLQDAFAGIETGQKTIEQTRKSYDISYDNFQEGRLLSSELLNVQNLRLQAEISYYVALSTFYSRKADLDYMVNDEK